jgi:hypothetical protein
MKRTRQEMEGGYRLDSIRRVKRYLYIAQTAILVFFAFFVMWTMDNISAFPFLIDLPTLLFFILLLLLIINIESFIFLRMELRYIKSHSTKYFLTRSSIRRSLVIIAVAAIAFLIFWTPFVNDAVKDAVSVRGDLQVGSAINPAGVSFMSSDPTMVVQAGKVSVDVEGGSVLVFLVTEENYDKYASQGREALAMHRINVNEYTADPTLEFDLPTLEYGKYFLVLYLEVPGEDVSANVDVEIGISSGMMDIMPILAMAFMIANLVWLIYIRPMNNMLRRRAIYS